MATSGLTLSLFGNIPEKLTQQSTWQTFLASGPVLWTIFLEKIDKNQCLRWHKALENYTPEGWDPFKVPLSQLTVTHLAGWGAKDPTVLECEAFPCRVKLNQQEVARLIGKPPAEKVQIFDQLLLERIRTDPENRLPYEFASPPLDPWKLIAEQTQSTPPSGPPTFSIETKIGTRKLSLSKQEFQSIAQILEIRRKKNPTYSEQTVWIRDIYTNHYFESWGEWMHLSCPTTQEPNEVSYWVHILVNELDLLKKTDFFSRIMHGKLKSAVQQETLRYLEHTFLRLKENSSH